MTAGKAKAAKTPHTTDTDEMKSVTESLYKQNLELAVKNKTLSLLEKLYKISIQNVGSKEMANSICATIQTDFNFERVRILEYREMEDLLEELACAESSRFRDARKDFSGMNQASIENVSSSSFFLPVLLKAQMESTEDLRLIWDNQISTADIEVLQEKTRARTALAYPIIIDKKVVAVCVIVLNRSYDELPSYECDAIQSVMNVIGLGLEKAALYQKLTESNAQLASANDRLRELDQLKTEFLSLASHQLRAPITAIKGYASLIVEGSFGTLSPQMNEAVQRIFESSKFMATTIDDFLNITRIEQGRMKYDITTFDVAPLVESTVEELRTIAGRRDLSIILEPAEGKIMVRADLGKTKQAITNLIDNAVKYTEKGEVRVSIRSNPDQKMAVLTITDTGIGISQEDQQRLFQKFSRAKNANSINVHGTGLGLYIVREMTKAQGGRVSVFSEGEGKGSTFTLELPLA